MKTIDINSDEPVKCGRCDTEIPVRLAETCHRCTGWLCSTCWEKFGECGHVEKEAVEKQEV